MGGDGSPEAHCYKEKRAQSAPIDGFGESPQMRNKNSSICSLLCSLVLRFSSYLR